MKTVRITGGTYPDFEKMEMARGDILLVDGKIAAVGPDAACALADTVIDATDRIVSPGFIDIHMHEEVIDPNGDPYHASYYAMQMGVTTCVAGNCGANRQDVKSFISYVKQHGSPVNYLLYLGHNFVREQVGITDRYRKATAYEMQQMADIAASLIPEGIIGLSYGMEYAPGVTYEEMLALAKPFDARHVLSAHYRYDGPRSVEALEELCEFSLDSGLPVQIAHVGSGSAYGMMTEALEKIASYVAKGAPVTADCYPYDAFGTRIGSAVFDDGCFERWNKTYADILLTEEPYRNVRCTEEIFLDARKNHPQMIVAAFAMNEAEVVQAIQAPFTFIASDSIYQKNMGHPRGAGTFPRVLGEYVRDRGHLTMIDALWKMTKGPADKLYLSKKGRIEPGADADITIFNPKTVIDRATFEEPTLPPEGIDTVLIAGEVALSQQRILASRLGRFVPATAERLDDSETSRYNHFNVMKRGVCIPNLSESAAAGESTCG